MYVYNVLMILFILICGFQPALACSLGSGMEKPTTMYTVNKYNKHSSVYLTKVIKIERDLKSVEKLKKYISENNSLTESKIEKIEGRLQQLHLSFDYSLEIKDLKSEIKKLTKLNKDNYKKLSKINSDLYSLRNTKNNDSQAIEDVKKNKADIIETIIVNKEKTLATENKIEIINLRKNYIHNDIEYYEKQLTHLNRNGFSSFPKDYRGPITVNFEIIERYKSNSKGDPINNTLTKTSEGKWPVCGDYNVDDYLYDAKLNDVTVFYGNQLGWRGKSKDESKIHEKMLAVQSGNYRDDISMYSIQNHFIDVRVGSRTKTIVINNENKLAELIVDIKKTKNQSILKTSQKYQKDVKVMAFFKDGTSEQLFDYKHSP